MQNYLLTTLPSGARVVSEPLDTVRSVALGLWIGTGSRDEDDAHAGVTHFLEHVLFKGTEKYSAQEIAEIFDGFGGELNAATARDYTVVYARVLDEHVEEALDVMTDMVFAPALVDLDAEREVILEEIAMVEDAPQELIHDLLTQAVFGNHPLGRPVLGSAEVIANVSRRSIAAYHRARYAAGNVVVAAAGNLAHDGLIALVEGMEAKIRPPGRRPAARAPWVTSPPPRLAFQRKETEQYHVCLGAPGISRSDKRRFTASILDGILGGSASSRLFQEIREKRGLAYTVYTFSSQYADTGQIGVYVGTREENLGACLEIVAEQIEAVSAGDVTEDELARAKENLKGRIMLSMELTSNRMSRLGKSVITDSELLDLDRILAEIEAVDAGSVAELTGALLARERLSIAAVGPSEKRVLKAVESVCPDLISAAAA
ncbi:MAG TPA: pitrilysin family protein [Gaiellaceae bacterium]|nr:pitrilysin family protein [Gaiellaceae bacterium]